MNKQQLDRLFNATNEHNRFVDCKKRRYVRDIGDVWYVGLPPNDYTFPQFEEVLVLLKETRPSYRVVSLEMGDSKKVARVMLSDV